MALCRLQSQALTRRAWTQAWLSSVLTGRALHAATNAVNALEDALKQEPMYLDPSTLRHCLD